MFTILPSSSYGSRRWAQYPVARTEAIKIRCNDHKFASVVTWCGGDFNADGLVDGLDFILWNANKFMSSDSVSAVPEPGTWVLWFVAVLLFGAKRKRR